MNDSDPTDGDGFHNPASSTDCIAKCSCARAGFPDSCDNCDGKLSATVALLEIVHLPDDADLHEAVLIALRALPSASSTAKPELSPSEDYPDCTTERERELYDALMGIASHATAFHDDYKRWTQGGVTLEPIVSKALRLRGGCK